ncbi:retrotransposon hot spot (RHS) protein, putative [Trypanosoma cruzi marinkellei]|uniref:Retrotransposon hot spot (RHS) protein, putative n=1 Tax=Trypanosoma cruzi marinkellei TaxID=85056 RepID=K2N6Z8_TRYCR|nr:retrotransposon hot spot (RHS) protein, putative [Trypanosoma cruzi marinkellei]
MIVVTSPNSNNYESWAKEVEAGRIIINCPEDSDVKAMCVWRRHNPQPAKEQAEEETEEEVEDEAGYWRVMERRINTVGPILRFIFERQRYKARLNECVGAVNAITVSKTEYYACIGNGTSWDGSSVSHKLVKVVRVRRVGRTESPLNVPISPHFERETLSTLENEMKQTDFIFLVLSMWDYVLPDILEKYAVAAFLNEDFLRAIRLKIKELKLTGRPEAHLCALVEHSDKSFTRKEVLPPLERPFNRLAIEYWVLYEPKVKNFPLVDCFFFVDSNPKTLVGMQITAASEHHTITSTVRQFTDSLAAYFYNWEELSRDMLWKIIYVQHAACMPINGWQRCDEAKAENVSEEESKEIAAFWKKKVHQYRAGVSA